MEQVTEEAFKQALTRHTAIMVDAEVGSATTRAMGHLIELHRDQLSSVQRELDGYEKNHDPKRPKSARHLVLEMDIRLGKHVIALIQKRLEQLSSADAAARYNLEAVRPLITRMKRELDHSIAAAHRAANPQ